MSTNPPSPHTPHQRPTLAPPLPSPPPVVSRYAVFCCSSVSLDIFECLSILPRHRYYLVITKVTTKAISGLIWTSHNDIFFGTFLFFFHLFLGFCFFNVDSLFGEMNVVFSFFFFFPFWKKKRKNTTEWTLFLFLLAHTNRVSFYGCTSTDFFHILQITYEIFKKMTKKRCVYSPCVFDHNASSSLHVMELETMYLSRLSEYGTEENVDWIYATIWFWPVAALNPLSCFPPFFCIFICPSFLRPAVPIVGRFLFPLC